MDINFEKLIYLLKNMDYYIEELVEMVLNNSEEDPHYSAVYASNTIKCYIQVMNELGLLLPYSSVEEYFVFNGYTQEEYQLFEKNRKKESQYYKGVQY